ncbi:MAG: 2-oxoacid:acceptor oxidoreductase family protein [Candidatus Rokubacteria bacterium]|nr:2-oxoacid:acceptor oxidoreductase family protein [Candidatus Rokubacteria bacterium]
MTRDGGNILLVGVGGQGVVLASAIVADAALRAGYDVKQSEVHGMSQRGGVVSSHLRYGPRVASPLVERGEADVVVAMEWNEGLRALPYLRPGAPLIVNLHRVVPPGACRDRASGRWGYPPLALDALVREVGDVRACDAMAIAREIGSPKALNSVLLGVLAPALPFPEWAWQESLEKNAPRGSFRANDKAFQAGRALRYPEETFAQAARATAAPNGRPDGQARATPPQLEVTERWCKGQACEICVRVCPEYCLAIGGNDTVVVTRPDACTGCRLCELLCPDFAIVVHDTLAAVE